ncbi:hypothetical protein [Corynebacterium aurimucosum]|uniref:hypothetical protein n=1 Tax=Corynebacterium aurimucosum TaxID=169292 RepID=UPI001F3DB5B6|nr:hypothetical protein [Corynebacterium aurimucosum]
MTRNSDTNPTTDGVDIPAALRVGGAFMLLAAVLALFGLVSIFTDGGAPPLSGRGAASPSLVRRCLSAHSAPNAAISAAAASKSLR